jgi:hypothetical protein
MTGKIYLLRRVSQVFLLVFVVMLFISKDSFMHDLQNHYDSAWFFMCGKAWMNGMTPYIDFADSKGPLLWLLYGVGYLFAPHSYVGVFWLSCIAWTVTLLLAWRSAAMLLQKEGEAFVAMLPVMLSGLCFIVHNETRAEDFAMPAVMFVVFALCRAVCGKAQKWWVDVLLGASAMATLLMKYNITLMLLPFVLLVWAVARKRSRACPGRSFALALGGAAAVAVPFVVYFMLKGCLADFVNEYFLVTANTTNGVGLFADTLRSIASPSGAYALSLFAISALCMAKMMPCYRRLTLLCSAWLFFVCAINSRPYYFEILSPFVLFLGVVVVKRFKVLQSRRAAVVASTFVAVFLIASNLYLHDLRHPDYGDFFTQDNASRREFYSIECMLSQVPNAKMVYAAGVNFGVVAEALPACKYFALQWNFDKAMLRQQIDACLEGKADFAIVQKEFTEYIDTLKKAGWQAFDFSEGPYKVVLMSRHRFAKQHDCCRMTSLDVFLKRQPQFCNSGIIK